MVFSALKTVFCRPIYWLGALAVAFFVVTFILLLPNYSVLSTVILSPAIGLTSKLTFVGSLYAGITTNFTIFSATVVLMIAMLFGINSALLLFYIKNARGASKGRIASTTTFSGAVAAFLGIGCAACGSAVLLVVLQFFGVGFVTSMLPLHGAEFGLVGILMLLLVLRSLAKKISSPLVCSVE